MKYFYLAVALALTVLSPLSVSASCPTAPPSFYLVVTYAGANCSSGFFGSTCAIAQPVQFTASWAGFGDPLQTCDVLTWNYGDGVIETRAPGELTTTHSYASSGNYVVTLSATNSLGSRTFFYSIPTVSVANGYFQFDSSCCNTPRTAEGLPLSFPVQRTSATGAASVQYATADISAVAGVNYVASTGTVNFAPGETQKIVTVPTIDDGVVHSDLYFHMILSNPTGGFLLRNSDLTATINDADPRPLLGFESATYTVSEGAGSVDIHVLRSVVNSSTVSVGYQISSSSGKPATVGSSGVLTFFPGETLKTIPVPILPTPNYDGDRSISMSLSSPTNGATFGQNPNTGNASITVKDDQPEPVVVFDSISVAEGNSGTTVVNVGATLTNPAGFDISVRPVLSDGTARFGRDYNYAQNQTLLIPAGQTTATTTFPVQILGNTTVEANKQFTIGGSANRTDCCSFTSVRTKSGTGTILNDDASVSPTRLSIVLGDVGHINANFGATPASPQSMTVSSSDPSVAAVATSVSVNGSGATIDVTAKALGSATITTTLPPAYGGASFSTDVYVYEGAALVLSPTTVSVPTGGTATISASFSPALQVAESATLKAAGDGTISAPVRITIDPGQTSTFTIKGLTRGTAYLGLTLGPSRGNAVSYVRIDVIDPHTTPTITQLVPANGPVAGGTNVTLNGANLRTDCTVRFGGVPAMNVAFVSANAMTATTPPLGAGPADVSLSCGSDTFVLTSGFTYLAASPTLSNVVPSFGATSGGTLVRITGTNFVSGCWPFFDKIPASDAVFKSPAEMTASVPPHSTASTVALTLRCTGIADTSLANAFTYSSASESAPDITNVDPLIGSAGKSVTITGARFRNDDRVTFDSTAAAVLATSPETHVVRIPEVPLGKTSITVTDAGNHASTTGPIFTIVEPQPPQIATVSPSTTRPGSEVTLDGSGFRPGYSFSIGDQPAALVSLSYTRVVIRIPQLTAGSYPINVLNLSSAIAAVGPSITILKPGLAITNVTPTCVRTAGGERMTISGTGFAAGAVVTFDGAIAAGATIVDSQTISLTLPILAAGMPRIVVTNGNGDTASLSNGFTATSPFAPDGCNPRPRPSRH